MSKLYIDVTELAGWQGKLTGVPRVMDELVRRFALDSETYFVRWQPQGYTQVAYPFAAHEIVASSPPRIKQLAKSAYERSRVAKKAVHASRKLASIQKKAVTQQYVGLAKGDVLLVLADWHGGDPSFVKYLVDSKNAGVKIVQIVYDMLPLVTPQYSGHSTEMLRRYSTTIYPLCDLIFSISEHTRKDIEAWLQKNKLHVPPISVFRLGDDFSHVASVAPKNVTLPKEYILCVGTIEARKNHTLLYYTYKMASRKGISLPPLVLVGRVGWLAEDIVTIMKLDPEVKDQIFILNNVNDAELAWLYENCEFTVYPSFYEGWGLPIAESIAYNKPVIASNTSSMTEIAGDIIKYFSPVSPEECLERIIELTDSDFMVKSKKDLKRYVPYSWDQTFESINEGIKGIK